MPTPIFRLLSVSLTGLVLFGCNKSSPPAATSATPSASNTTPVADSKEQSKPQSNPAEPKVADADRRAAEWVLRVDGAVRVVLDGVPQEIKKGEKLPAGKVKLVAIDLRGAQKATDDGREYLQGLPGVRELTINDGARIRNLDFLADMTGLELLNSEGFGPLITDKDLDHIKGMPNLKKLIIVSQVRSNPDLTDKVFPVVKDLKKLELLRLCNCGVTDGGVRQLDGHASLSVIDFWKSNGVGDAALLSLVSLPKLEQVGVQGTQVTDAGVKDFKAKAPKCRVIK